MDRSSGALRYVSKTSGVVNPSFLAFDPQQRFLYAVNEVEGHAGQPAGAVSAYSVAPKTGELSYLNQQPSHGALPCHLSVDRTGRALLVANYGTGNVTVLPIMGDGRLGKATDVVQHEGSGIDPERQEGPHAHSITIDAANRYAFAADLGLDKVLVYRLDVTRGKLIPNDQPWVDLKPGAGPRHFDFHPSRRYAYVINELDSTLTAFTYDETTGTLQEVQTVSTLPEGFGGISHCADVHVSPSGEFVYGSNRGHDSIVVFAIDQNTGKVSYVDHESTQGRTPRNFAIDPSGSFLLVANQGTDTVVTFRIDPQNGKLDSTGNVAQVPAPVCLRLASLSI